MKEVAKVDYNKKEMKAFTLLCEHLTDAQLAHIQYCDNVKSVWEALCGVHETKTIGNKLFLWERYFTIKMQEGDDMLVHINMVKHTLNPCGPTKFHWGEDYRWKCLHALVEISQNVTSPFTTTCNL